MSHFPDLMAEWHTELNIGTDPRKVPAGTGKLIWWKCPEAPDHEWPAQVRSRTMRGTGCRFCTTQITLRSVSIEATHPEIAAQWHSTKNGSLLPSQVSYGSQRQVFWACTTGIKSHDFQQAVKSRTAMGIGCPKCARKAGKGGAPRKRGRPTKKRAPFGRDPCHTLTASTNPTIVPDGA